MYVRLSSRRRKQLHSDLRSDVERMGVYRDIVDDAPDIIAIISPDVQSHVLYINDTVRRVLHLEPSGLLGSSFGDLVHTEDKALFFKALTTTVFFISATKVEPVRCLLQDVLASCFLPYGLASFSIGTAIHKLHSSPLWLSHSFVLFYLLHSFQHGCQQLLRRESGRSARHESVQMKVGRKDERMRVRRARRGDEDDEDATIHQQKTLNT